MCNPNIPSVTLQTAVLIAVKEFAEKKTKFSSHDITRILRNKCNTGKMEIPEIEDLSGIDGYRFNVNHEKVRNLFQEMINNGVFAADFVIQRQFNGMYYEYVTISSPTKIPPVSVPPQYPTNVQTPLASIPVPVVCQTTDPEIIRRITQYLDNCKARNFRPNLKQIQSAIKRGNYSTGVSQNELSDFIQNSGYRISRGDHSIESHISL